MDDKEKVEAIRNLPIGTKINLLPDPDEGFDEGEVVYFSYADFDNEVMTVVSEEHGIFEVGFEQYGGLA